MWGRPTGDAINSGTVHSIPLRVRVVRVPLSAAVWRVRPQLSKLHYTGGGKQR